MVEIQSKEVIDKISEELKVQPSLEIPRELAKNIQLVYNINQVDNGKMEFDSITNATTGNIHTTHTTKDTWLLAVYMTVTKDVVNDSTQSNVRAVLFGDTVGKILCSMPYQPITAETIRGSFVFPIPIKLAKGTLIDIRNGAGTAEINTTASIVFTERDPL